VPVGRARFAVSATIGEDVTRHAKPGNPANRMFRAVAERTLSTGGLNKPGPMPWRPARDWPRPNRSAQNIRRHQSRQIQNTPLRKPPRITRSPARPLGRTRFIGRERQFTQHSHPPRYQDKIALDEISPRGRKPKQRPRKNSSRRDPIFTILVKLRRPFFEALDEILELAGPRHTPASSHNTNPLVPLRTICISEDLF